MIEELGIAVASSLVFGAAGWFGRHWVWRDKPHLYIALGERRCETCKKLLPKDAIRSAVGWRCSEHKSV